MTTLLQLFDEERAQLSQRINNKPTPEVTVSAVKDFLDSLLTKYRKDEDHDPDQNRFAVQVIDQMKASISTLVAACETEIWKQDEPVVSRQPDTDTPPATNLTNLVIRGLQVLLATGILVLLWLERSFIYFALVTSLVVLELARTGLGFFKRRSDKLLEKAYERTFAPEVPKLKAAIHVKADILLAKLADALLAADKVLGLVGTLNKPVVADGGLESDSEMLDLLLDLLEARDSQDAEYALKQIKSIPYHLSRYGIKVETFSGENENLFEFQPSLNPSSQTRRTLRPALLKNQRLLKRGLVEEPN